MKPCVVITSVSSLTSLCFRVSRVLAKQLPGCSASFKWEQGLGLEQGGKLTQGIYTSPRIFLCVRMVEALKLVFQEGLSYAAHFPVIHAALPLRRTGEDFHLRIASLLLGSLHYHPPREDH